MQIRRVDEVGTSRSGAWSCKRLSHLLLLLSEATGEYVYFMGTQRWLTSNNCRTLLAILLLRHSSIDIGYFGCNLLFFDI